MILLESGRRDTRSFEAKVQFAHQMADRGIAAYIDDETVPEDLYGAQKYDAARFLTPASTQEFNQILVLGAEEISDETLASLRGYRLTPATKMVAIGRFETTQSKISATSKIAYTVGFEPNVVNLSEIQPSPILEQSVAPLFASMSPRAAAKSGPVKLFLVIPIEQLDDPQIMPALTVLSQTHGVHCSVVTAGAGKRKINTSRHSSLNVIGFSDLSPGTLAGVADVAAFFGPNMSGERMAAFALNLMGRNGAVIDCTEQGSIASSGAPAIRGPVDIIALAAFLQASILENLDTIGQATASHAWLQANDWERLEHALDFTSLRSKASDQASGSRTVFFPTNGVGLGHAQRCLLIAKEMDKSEDIAFAAFPSCIPMVQDKGYDCLPMVQKSPDHSDPFANDLVNYLRFQRHLQAPDHFVFDGGYIFESVYRNILDKKLNATWIRRGLWRPGQSAQSPVEREHAFGQIIAPDEAFPELNATQLFGSPVQNVGPIVQINQLEEPEKSRIRTALQKKFDIPFKKLVVSMLGSGVAADRTAQMQTLCGILNDVPDCLHLIVVWPNAKIASPVTGWPNTRIVTTRQAVNLAQAADFVVSAAGYNSFNELMYHQVPAIFIPQVASFMDDQERRARAASDRGLGTTVMSHELFTLEKEMHRYLDGSILADISNKFSENTLPGLGNKKAAGLLSREAKNV